MTDLLQHIGRGVLRLDGATGTLIQRYTLTEADFRVLQGDIISDRKVQEEAGLEAYDLVLANILADIIIPLQKTVWKQMKMGACLNVSGIINIREEQVREALTENPHYELVDTEHQGEWVSFTVRRVS